MTATKFIARFTTAGKLTAVENWLQEHITGHWSFKLEGVSDDMSRKDYLLIFDHEVDRESFLQTFMQKKPDESRNDAKTATGVLKKIQPIFGRLFTKFKLIKPFDS